MAAAVVGAATAAVAAAAVPLLSSDPRPLLSSTPRTALSSPLWPEPGPEGRRRRRDPAVRRGDGDGRRGPRDGSPSRRPWSWLVAGTARVVGVLGLVARAGDVLGGPGGGDRRQRARRRPSRHGQRVAGDGQRGGRAPCEERGRRRCQEQEAHRLGVVRAVVGAAAVATATAAAAVVVAGVVGRRARARRARPWWRSRRRPTRLARTSTRVPVRSDEKVTRSNLVLEVTLTLSVPRSASRTVNVRAERSIAVTRPSTWRVAAVVAVAGALAAVLDDAVAPAPAAAMPPVATAAVATAMVSLVLMTCLLRLTARTIAKGLSGKRPGKGSELVKRRRAG